MPLTDPQQKSWNCQRCEFELAEIEKNTIEKIIEILNPNFLSLSKDYKSKNREQVKICPRCDSHPLGIETEHIFPIRTKSGDRTTING